MAPSTMLRALLHRLFTDPDFRRAFIASPEAALPDPPLAPEERQALRRLRRRLATTAGSQEEQAAMIAWP